MVLLWKLGRASSLRIWLLAGGLTLATLLLGLLL